jgi:prolipoprotein diacylglyceryl transferase
MLAYIQWDFDPTIHLGVFHPKWYGAMMATGIAFAFFMVSDIYRRSKVEDKYMISLLYMIVAGALIGARLGEVFFYNFADYKEHPLEIVKIWNGGLSSHGATIGIIIMAFIYAKWVIKKPFLWVGDRIVAGVAITAAFVRIGNFCNSEIVGKYSNVPWAVVFKRHYNEGFADVLPRHPTQIYEAIAYIILSFSLYVFFRKKQDKFKTGTISAYFLIGMFCFRFLIEFLKEIQESFESSLILDMGQLLSIPFICYGFAILFYSKKSEQISLKN